MKNLNEKVFGKRENTSLISSKARSRASGRHLLFEPLEERQMLAITPADYDTIRAAYPDLNLSENMADYNVIEITESQLTATNLQNAINSAAQTPENDLIVVRTTETVNTVTLGGSELAINTNAATQGSVTIVSLGTEKLTIDANQQSRVFNIVEDAEVGLGGLVITGGYTTDSGGGIYSTGTLTVADCTISGNTATSTSSSTGGGGIDSYGTLTVTNSTISGNSVSSTYTYGGGISSTGTLTVTNSTISGNMATGNNSYGCGISCTGTLTVTNSTISSAVSSLKVEVD